MLSPQTKMAEFTEDELIQLSFLRDEEIDALVKAGFIPSGSALSSSLDQRFNYQADEFTLEILTGPTYPLHLVHYVFENQTYPQDYINTLRVELDKILELSAEKNTLNRWNDREKCTYGVFKPHQTVLALVIKAREHLDQYHDRLLKGKLAQPQNPRKHDKYSWFIKNRKQAVEPSSLRSLNEVAYNLLGQSPKRIANMIPGGLSGFRVLHVEQILRLDLSQRHETFRTQLRSRLRRCSTDQLRKFMPPGSRTSRLDDMVDHLIKSRITFHGTKRQYVPSIVRHGFVAAGKHNPTTGRKSSVRCGSTYGRGVYSSPDASFALSYSGEGGQHPSAKEFYGIKLIACATIMGRPRCMGREDEWYEEEEAHETADSHIGNDELEYIVFGKAQTIPVYVIHLDWGYNNMNFFNKIPGNRKEWQRPTQSAQDQQETQEDGIVYPGDKQRAKEAVFAKAAKYFPYGYGPAMGSKFVVEEVGEVSDDVEEYGEYQALRIDEDESGEANTEFWSWVKVGAEEEHETSFQGSHAADEYVQERHALGVPLGYKRKASEWDELGHPGEDRVPGEEDVFGLQYLMEELPDKE